MTPLLVWTLILINGYPAYKQRPETVVLETNIATQEQCLAMAKAINDMWVPGKKALCVQKVLTGG